MRRSLRGSFLILTTGRMYRKRAGESDYSVMNNLFIMKLG